MKNVLFVASEAVPFIKTGGLADLVLCRNAFRKSILMSESLFRNMPV